MSVFKAVYYRYHTLKHEDFESFQEAMVFLDDGSDRNELSRLCIIWNGEISWVNNFYDLDWIKKECKEFLTKA
jgi:hypothetical protein